MSDTRTHIRHSILFCFELGLSAGETERQVCTAIGPSAVHINTVRSWFKRFSSGDKSLEDKAKSGRPSPFDVDALLNLVESNATLTTRCMATTLGCSHTTIENQLHSLGKVSKLCRWVPHDLSQNDRQRRLDSSLLLLSKSRNFSWLDHLVSGDEKWCFYVNHTRKRSWVSAEEEPKKDTSTGASSSKGNAVTLVEYLWSHPS